jgi:N-acetylneuraminic acid mutarotase
MRSLTHTSRALLLIVGMAALSSCASSATPPTDPPQTETPPTPTDVPTPAEGVWETAPSLLNARAAHAVVSTDTAIYVLAGTGAGGSPVLDVESFDGSAWSIETTLPGDGLNAPAAALVDVRLYLIGGFSTTSNVPVSDVHVYDIAAKSWSDAAPLPAPRGGHAAVVLDGKLHIFGGGNSRTTLADHSMYDPASDTWTDLAPLPLTEGSPAGAVLNGKIYAIGGRSGTSDYGSVYVYDAAADTWEKESSIDPRGTAGAVVLCDTIYLFGGESQSQNAVLSDVLRLDPASGTWEALTPMPTARNFARAVLIGDAVYVVGGSLEPMTSHASAGSTVVEKFRASCP